MHIFITLWSVLLSIVAKRAKKIFMGRVHVYIFSLFLLTFISFSTQAERAEVVVEYFDQQILVSYDTNMNVSLDTQLNENAFEHFYLTLERSNYMLLLANLMHWKKEMRLNDWLYYVLVRNSIDAIFSRSPENYKTLVCWFYLHKSGYRVQLNYTNNHVLLSVFTIEMVYDMPTRKVRDGYYVDVTSHHNITTLRKELVAITSPLLLNYSGIPFSFKLEKVPEVPQPEIVVKTLSFLHKNKSYKIDVNVNKSVIYMMHRYPELSVKQHAMIPLSNEAHQSLIPALQSIVNQMDEFQAIQFLLSLTRQSKKYKTDREAYGTENLTFTAEETLFYNFSDCEDRSVLFHYLVENLLGLETIILDYPEHASTAVKMTEAYGRRPILYKEHLYTICDPTGPGNHLRPGDYPDKLDTVPFSIIEE